MTAVDLSSLVWECLQRLLGGCLPLQNLLLWPSWTPVVANPLVSWETVSAEKSLWISSTLWLPRDSRVESKRAKLTGVGDVPLSAPRRTSHPSLQSGGGERHAVGVDVSCFHCSPQIGHTDTVNCSDDMIGTREHACHVVVVGAEEYCE